MGAEFRNRVVRVARRLAGAYLDGPEWKENRSRDRLARYVLSVPDSDPVFDELISRALGPTGRMVPMDDDTIWQVLDAVWPGVAATPYAARRERVARRPVCDPRVPQIRSAVGFTLMISLFKVFLLLACAQLPDSEAVSFDPVTPPAPTKVMPAAVSGRLIPPPPVLTPGSALASSSPGVVPGGPVYELPPWFVDLIHELERKPAKPGPVPVPWPVIPQPSVTSPAAIVDGVNGERARVNLPALEFDAKLTATATYWSQWQAQHDRMTHGPGSAFANRIWSVWPGTQVGEIVAGGYPTVPDVISGWHNSPGHYRIMTGDFSKAGAGVATSRNGQLYWTVDFVK